MTSRDHLPWHLAGYGCDPIPGDPDLVETKAGACRASAANIGQAADQLRKLTSRDSTISDAIRVIMAKASETATTLDVAKVRYSALSNALTPYASSLRTAQRDSEEAVSAVSAASGQIRSASTRRAAARNRLNSADETVRCQAQEDVQLADASLKSAQSSLADAKTKIQAAIASRNAAADAAASKIDMDLADSPLDDTLWDKLGDFVATAGKWVWEHLDEIALVLDLFAFVLALTGVGGPIAAALMLVSKVLHALSKIKMIIDVGLAVYQGFTTGDWTSAGVAIGGAVIGAVVSFGVGKGIGKFVAGKSGAAKWMTKIGMKAGRNSYESSKLLWGNSRSWYKNASPAIKSLFGAPKTLFTKEARRAFTVAARTGGGKLLSGAAADGVGLVSQYIYKPLTAGVSTPTNRILGVAR